MSGLEPEVPEEGLRQHRFTAPTGATTILLVRHGESQPAHPDRPFPLIDGHGDPPLAEEGELQAERVGARLAAEHAAGATIDGLYVTTLRRTHQTAGPLASRIGIEPSVVADLREVHLGDWEGGQLRLRAFARDPLFLRVLEEERWDVIPGAETLADFDARLRRGVSTIASAHPDGRVVTVVHGGVIAQLLAIATGSRPFAFAGADNASISELVVTGDGRWHVRRFNDVSHL